MVVPYAHRGTLGAAEEAVLAVLDPPLNLSGRPPTTLRRRLTQLRAELARPPSTTNDLPTQSGVNEAAPDTAQGSGAPDAQTLVIVPCGSRKIWDEAAPGLGPVTASDAYTSTFFRKDRAYAECFGTRWVILSAKYGFISQDFHIPGPYNVTFNDPLTDPIGVAALVEQRRAQHLDAFAVVIGLGGKQYREIIESVFAGTRPALTFPFAGLRIGEQLQGLDDALRRAEKASSDVPVRSEIEGSTGAPFGLTSESKRRSMSSWRDIMANGEAAKRLLLRNRAEGEAWFEELFQEHPQDGMLFFKRGEAYGKLGELDRAFADLYQAEQLLPLPQWKVRAQSARMRLEQKNPAANTAQKAGLEGCGGDSQMGGNASLFPDLVGQRTTLSSPPRRPYVRSYAPITRWLAQQDGDRVEVRFAELEEVLGQALPHSAHRLRIWWANSSSSQGHAWLDADFKVVDVDFAKEQVVFTKPSESEPTSSSIAAKDCPLCGNKIVERSNARTGNLFFGCSRFPNCRYTRTISVGAAE